LLQPSDVFLGSKLNADNRDAQLKRRRAEWLLATASWSPTLQCSTAGTSFNVMYQHNIGLPVFGLASSCCCSRTELAHHKILGM
jgi:hypothetical protein